MRRNVQMIEEFDMLIGSSAVHHGYVMVTENLDHFERIPGIEIENWVERPKKTWLNNERIDKKQGREAVERPKKK